MLITNPNSLPFTVFKCSKKIGEHLIKQNKIPLLAMENNKYCFSKTEKLQKAINNLPLWLKVFCK